MIPPPANCSPLGAADAGKELMARCTGTAKVARINRINADSPPLELTQGDERLVSSG